MGLIGKISTLPSFIRKQSLLLIHTNKVAQNHPYMSTSHTHHFIQTTFHYCLHRPSPRLMAAKYYSAPPPPTYFIPHYRHRLSHWRVENRERSALRSYPFFYHTKECTTNSYLHNKNYQPLLPLIICCTILDRQMPIIMNAAFHKVWL